MAVAEMPSPTSVAPSEPRIVLNDVSWSDYDTLTKIFDGRASLRMTYNQGSLELMTISYEHERLKAKLHAVLTALCAAFERDYCSGGSMTVKRESELRGLEADLCYWIAHEPAIRGKNSYDLGDDPPPDLAIEIEVSRSSESKLDIYSSLDYPEVWRFDCVVLRCFQLQADNVHIEVKSSLSFPEIELDDVVKWVRNAKEKGELQLHREIIAWVNAGMPPLE